MAASMGSKAYISDDNRVIDTCYGTHKTRYLVGSCSTITGNVCSRIVDVESSCPVVTTGLSQRLGAGNDEVGLVQWDIAQGDASLDGERVLSCLRSAHRFPDVNGVKDGEKLVVSLRAGGTHAEEEIYFSRSLRGHSGGHGFRLPGA